MPLGADRWGEYLKSGSDPRVSVFWDLARLGEFLSGIIDDYTYSRFLSNGFFVSGVFFHNYQSDKHREGPCLPGVLRCSVILSEA